MGEQLSVARDLQFGTYEAIGELARFDPKRADVLGERLCREWIILRVREDHLQNAIPGVGGRTVDDDDEMRCEFARQRLGNDPGKIDAGEIQSRGRTLDLAHGEFVDEQRRDDVHALRTLPL